MPIGKNIFSCCRLITRILVNHIFTGPSERKEEQTSPCQSATKIVTLPKKGEHQPQKNLMTRMQLNDHKAGMQGLDKEHINRIIYEVSKGNVTDFKWFLV